jgi:hypothetical protein
MLIRLYNSKHLVYAGSDTLDEALELYEDMTWQCYLGVGYRYQVVNRVPLGLCHGLLFLAIEPLTVKICMVLFCYYNVASLV